MNTGSLKHKILVVEDEEAILFGITENLSAAGYDVSGIATGTEALQSALSNHYDLILLDVMLPGISGYEICRRIREKGISIPIIMLTARGEEFDKLHGFEVGADDYVTKPFSLQELMARIKALLARTAAPRIKERKITFGSITLDLDARILLRRKKTGKGSANEETITLTKTEFDLLEYFINNEGRALSREEVMNDVWSTQYLGTQRSLDSFVASLRQKIEIDPHNPEHIQTVHGVGYKFISGERSA